MLPEKVGMPMDIGKVEILRSKWFGQQWAVENSCLLNCSQMDAAPL
jgi:hypothetical protein